MKEGFKNFLNKGKLIALGTALSIAPIKVKAQVEANKDSTNVPFASTSIGQALIKKYAFTQPAGANDNYFDEIQYEKLPKEGLTNEQIIKIMPFIRGPLTKIPNPTVAPVEGEGTNIDYGPDQLDLLNPSTRNKDMANIGKYAPDENLKPRKPFGYREDENSFYENN